MLTQFACTLRRQFLVAIAIACISSHSQAALTITSVIGGAPTGVNYVNFNNLVLGAAGGTSGGLGVSFAGGADAVQGTAGWHAAPYISNSNGSLFGDSTTSGPDITTYVSTEFSGNIRFALPGPELYFGLLWGSVDVANTLAFLDASGNVVGTITGTDITANANGNQGALGTYYVNINSTIAFTTVVASGETFEIDNVAFNPTIPVVPEPSTGAMIGFGLLGVACVRVRAGGAADRLRRILKSRDRT